MSQLPIDHQVQSLITSSSIRLLHHVSTPHRLLSRLCYVKVAQASPGVRHYGSCRPFIKV